MSYNVQEIRNQWRDWKDVRVWYGAGESGWAKRMPDGNLIITCHPLEDRLNFMDVVESVEQNDRLICGKIIWRAFPIKTGIKYPADRNRFDQIRESLKAKELSYEGYTLGWMAVTHGEDDDIETILREGDVDMTDVQVLAWDEDKALSR